MSGGASFLILAAVYGASGVALGAFGAHGLRAQLDSGGLETWRTAVLYHLVHALALLAVGVWTKAMALAGQAAHPALGVAGWSIAAGVLLFSGSLYLLALGGPRFLGPITPIGGVAFLIGWGALLWAAVRSV